MTKFRLGLLGYPLEHSLSPQLHQAMLASLNLEGRYELIPIPPTEYTRRELPALLTRMRSGELQGLNVTIPYKSTVINYLDSLSPVAKATGAVNAILVRDGKLVGENFDCPAFGDDLADFLRQAGLAGHTQQADRVALVLGAGGAARSVVYSLICNGWQVKVVARRIEQAQELARAFQNRSALTIGEPGELSDDPAQSVELIVNATPLGMYPNCSASPWPDGVALPKQAMVYDLVYNPPETALIGLARRTGLPAANGLGMLVRQAAMSLTAWTGCTSDWQHVFSPFLNARYPGDPLPGHKSH